MKHLYFWLACINIIYCVCGFLFILWWGCVDVITIHKTWALILIPLIINLGLCFIIFYNKLLEEE